VQRISRPFDGAGGDFGERPLQLEGLFDPSVSQIGYADEIEGSTIDFTEGLAMRTNKKWIWLMTLLLAGCTENDTQIYTLYREDSPSPLTDEFRLHVATFDAKEGEAYNRENCESARDLFQSQRGVSVRYWCENGRYRK
jgi:hypothetical protein